MSIVLSNRQLPMLEALAGVSYMNVDEAAYYDQRPFASMLRRDYCVYVPGKGFKLTEKGRQARTDFYGTDIGRKNPRSPLTKYFDLNAYGLKPPVKKARVHVMKHKGAA